MAKYSGEIGYKKSYEYSPGVWRNQLLELPVQGNVESIVSRNQDATQRSNDIQLNMRFSLLVGRNFKENVMHIVYVTYMGEKWAVNSIEFQNKRVILNVGGLYHEE